MLAVDRAVRIMSNQLRPAPSAGIGSPWRMPCETTLRSPGTVACRCLAKNGASISPRAGSSAKAMAMSFSMVERMMQPARQTFAISGSGSDQPKAFDASTSSPNPCA